MNLNNMKSIVEFLVKGTINKQNSPFDKIQYENYKFDFNTYYNKISKNFDKFKEALSKFMKEYDIEESINGFCDLYKNIFKIQAYINNVSDESMTKELNRNLRIIKRDLKNKCTISIFLGAICVDDCYLLAHVIKFI